MRPVWAAQQQNRRVRGHDFYHSGAELGEVPEMSMTDSSVRGMGGKICHAHYFSPTDDVYVLEIDPVDGSAFTIWRNPYDEVEYATVSLPELESRMWTGPEGMPRYFERELGFTPRRAVQALPDELSGRAAERLEPAEYRALESQFENWRRSMVEGEDQQVCAELEQLWRDRAEQHQLDVHVPEDLNINFRGLAITNQPGWVDEEVMEMRKSHRR